MVTHITGSCVICHDTERLRKKWDCIACHACVTFHYGLVYRRTSRRPKDCSSGRLRRGNCEIDYTLDKAACRFCRLNKCFESGWPRTRQAMVHYEYRRIFGWIPSERNVPPPTDLRDKANLTAIRRRLRRIRRRQRLSDAEDNGAGDEDDDWAMAPKCSICSRRRGQQGAGKLLLQVRGLTICNKCQVFISKTRAKLLHRRVPTILYNCRRPHYKGCSHCRFMKALEFGWFREHFDPRLRADRTGQQQVPLATCSECGFLFERPTQRDNEGGTSDDDDDDQDLCRFCKELMQAETAEDDASPTGDDDGATNNRSGGPTTLDDSGLFSRSSDQSVSCVEIGSSSESEAGAGAESDASTTIYDTDFYEYDRPDGGTQSSQSIYTLDD